MAAAAAAFPIGAESAFAGQDPAPGTRGSPGCSPGRGRVRVGTGMARAAAASAAGGQVWEDGPGGVVWRAADIAAAAEGRLVREGPPGSICTDTRKLRPGDWFLALLGSNYDGHDWVPEAVARGCAGVVGSAGRAGRGWEGLGLGLVEVEGDTVKALHRLGGSVRKRFRGPVVGITGSVGKTTARAMTALALESLGHVHQTEGNLNNRIGVPLTLLKMPACSQACVLELGMNHSLEILELARIARPSVRVLLNVGPAHLENFGCLQDVAEAKGEIMREAGAGDVCVLNADDPLVMALPVPEGVTRVLFGRKEGCHLRLVSTEATRGGFGSRVVLEHYSYGDKKLVSRVEMEIFSPGPHLAINACAAAAVATSLGVPLAAAVESISSKYSPVGMRSRLESEETGVVIINDAYNANPMSMVNALKMLHSVDVPYRIGRRIAILGDMQELGKDSPSAHTRIVEMAVRETKVDVLCLVGSAFRAAAEALNLLHQSCQVFAWATSADLASEVVERLAAAPGDVILVKGSRGMKMEVIVEVIKSSPRHSSAFRT